MNVGKEEYVVEIVPYDEPVAEPIPTPEKPVEAPVREEPLVPA